MKAEHVSLQELSTLLDGNETRDETIERHLETCTACRKQLESLAGDASWWSETRSQLSSLSEPRSTELRAGNESRGLPARFAQQLLDAPKHPEMLGRIGRFDVERIVGQGGFGVVFKAYDSELNRAVAIKVLSPHLANSGVARKRFAREAQAAAAVNHPNVVPIHAVDASAELPYLVMTYVPGHSLQTVVGKYGPLEPKSIVRIAMQIAAGLSAAHAQGLVHRDIKPANILLENDMNRAMITDFGLARAADDAAATQTGWLAGTPHYMSPEQARGEDIDARSDLFSLGSVIYFMATGREPFRGDTPLAVLRQIGEQTPLSAHRINSDIPRPLSDLIDRLLQKDPRHRLQSAGELEKWLERYLAHLQSPQSCPSPSVKLPRRRSRPLAVWTLGALAFSAVAVAVWPLLSNGLFSPPNPTMTKIVSQPEPPPRPLAVLVAEAANVNQEDQVFFGEMIAIEQELGQMEKFWTIDSIEDAPSEPVGLQEIREIAAELDYIDELLSD